MQALARIFSFFSCVSHFFVVPLHPQRFEAEKFIPMQEVKYGAKHLNQGSSILSTTHSLQKEYEHISQTHY